MNGSTSQDLREMFRHKCRDQSMFLGALRLPFSHLGIGCRRSNRTNLSSLSSHGGHSAYRAPQPSFPASMDRIPMPLHVRWRWTTNHRQ
eukprot:scaffold89628_cov32-Tisochrysis_lutea.AAC.5